MSGSICQRKEYNHPRLKREGKSYSFLMSREAKDIAAGMHEDKPYLSKVVLRILQNYGQLMGVILAEMVNSLTL